MAQIIVTDRSGSQEAIDIRPGTTLMQEISDAGIADLLAICGGVCNCATCHVYVEGDCVDSLPAMSSDEDDLLAFTEHRQANSRLSCQIRMSNELDGLRATIAPED